MLVAAGGDRDDKPDGSALRLWTQGDFLVPGFIAWGDAIGALSIDHGTSVALHLRPVPLGGLDGARGIAGEGRARLGAVEQIKPLLARSARARGWPGVAAPRATAIGS